MSILTYILNNWYFILTAVLTAYLMGSINTAVIVTKIVTRGKEDIRQMGSRNAGFTNVLRSVGKVPAAFTIAGDLIKAIVAVLLGGWLFSLAFTGFQNIDSAVKVGKYVCGFFCILGHSYPLYFHFKGGKGVVTAAGMMLVVDWRVFIIIVATFLIIFLFTKIISLADIICACMFPVYTFIMSFFIDYLINAYSGLYVALCTAASFGIGLFVLIKHKSNIQRLIKGEEKKITAKK